MDFQSMVDDHRSQLVFYRKLCMTLSVLLGIISVSVPLLMRSGPYLVQDSESLYSVSKAQPWKLTVTRLEGFLKLYLTGRFDWSKENFADRRKLLKEIIADPAFQKLKDSLLSLETVSKNQSARGFYVLEGYRFSNERKVIEAQISRIIRVGATGVVTPLLVRLFFDEAAVSEQNPYGLKIKALEEMESGSLSANEGRDK